jgi:hypothetical protein
VTGTAPRCLICGQRLQAHVGLPQDAPWQCKECRRGFFAAELTPAAQLLWRPETRDHGYGTEVADAIRVELKAAVLRRTCVTEDMLTVDDVAARVLRYRGVSERLRAAAERVRA